MGNNYAVTHYHSTVIHSSTWLIKIHHYGMDHDLSPPWTLHNIAKALKFGLFIEPPEQSTIERNIAFQMGSPFKSSHGSLTHPKAAKQSLSLLQEQTTTQYPP